MPKTPKEITETVEIAVQVRICYSTPEGRERAVQIATKELHINLWSSECGGISVKSLKQGRELKPNAPL